MFSSREVHCFSDSLYAFVHASTVNETSSFRCVRVFHPWYRVVRQHLDCHLQRWCWSKSTCTRFIFVTIKKKKTCCKPYIVQNCQVKNVEGNTDTKNFSGKSCRLEARVHDVFGVHVATFVGSVEGLLNGDTTNTPTPLFCMVEAINCTTQHCIFFVKKKKNKHLLFFTPECIKFMLKKLFTSKWSATFKLRNFRAMIQNSYWITTFKC